MLIKWLVGHIPYQSSAIFICFLSALPIVRHLDYVMSRDRAPSWFPSITWSSLYSLSAYLIVDVSRLNRFTGRWVLTAHLGTWTWCIQHYYRWCAHLACRLNWRPCRFKWTRPFRPKDEIWFLRMSHHISNAVYYKHVTVVCTPVEYDLFLSSVRYFLISTALWPTVGVTQLVLSWGETAWAWNSSFTSIYC
jgi:hypothetical protein